MLIEHRQAVIQQIDDLKHHLEAIRYKIGHYNTLCSLHVESNPANTLAHDME